METCADTHPRNGKQKLALYAERKKVYAIIEVVVFGNGVFVREKQI